MRFEISHSIRYFYSEPVFLEPMIVRLRPRCNAVQQVRQFALDVEPSPAGISECIDLDGNNTATLWFNGLFGTLSIFTRSLVEVLPVNPFNFILTDNAVSKLPASYPGAYRYALEPYLSRRCESYQVNAFVQPIVKETDGETIPFLVKLASRIHEQFEKESRETGNPMMPDKTIARRKGACRDLAVLFIEACRAVGLAARFVSGYGYRVDIDSLEKRHLHAWAEVYLPGGGWRGFDPSIGLAVADQHVAVAAAADPVNAAPTSGTFRGTGVRSEIEYDVYIFCPAQTQSSNDYQQ